MCLQFCVNKTQPSISDAWLHDFHDHNPDGWGFMTAYEGSLITHKAMGTAKDFIKDYRRFEADYGDFAIHLRMRTHGETNLANVHPYTVIEGEMSMMHNGILHTGYGLNGDKAHSDTYHFIKDYIVPMLEYMPHMFDSPEFCAMLGEFIGNNRFIICTDTGSTYIINEQQFHNWHGIMMSNTYAWSSSRAPHPSEGPREFGYKSWGKNLMVSEPKEYIPQKWTMPDMQDAWDQHLIDTLGAPDIEDEPALPSALLSPRESFDDQVYELEALGYDSDIIDLACQVLTAFEYSFGDRVNWLDVECVAEFVAKQRPSDLIDYIITVREETFDFNTLADDLMETA